MQFVVTLLGFLSLVATGGLFGVFAAWPLTGMWGLDAAEPRLALEAMRAMTTGLREGVFVPVVFATPFLLFLTAFAASRRRAGGAAAAFGLAGLVVLAGALAVTLLFHIPMAETLAAEPLPDGQQAAGRHWQEFTARWRELNLIRAGASGAGLLLTGAGLFSLSRATSQRSLSRL